MAIHVNRILVLTYMDAYIAKNTENNLHVNDNFVISINKRCNYNCPFPRHFFPNLANDSQPNTVPVILVPILQHNLTSGLSLGQLWASVRNTHCYIAFISIIII